MNRIFLGALGALLLVSAGVFWWEGRAEVEPRGSVMPTARPLGEDIAAVDPVDANLGDAEGPELPRATEQTREQRRFDRLDRDRDGRITRNEMLSPRVKDFRKLDLDGNNLLSFEEWAVATSNKFKKADANGNGALDRTEYATTKIVARKPACRCR